MPMIILTQERGDPVLINSDWIVHATRVSSGDAPDFVEVGEVGIAVDDAMRHQRCLQLVC